MIFQTLTGLLPALRIALIEIHSNIPLLSILMQIIANEKKSIIIENGNGYNEKIAFSKVILCNINNDKTASKGDTAKSILKIKVLDFHFNGIFKGYIIGGIAIKETHKSTR